MVLNFTDQITLSPTPYGATRKHIKTFIVLIDIPSIEMLTTNEQNYKL